MAFQKKPGADFHVPKRSGRGPAVSMEKRAAMLQAATLEFGKAGYASVSMDAIAARANVSKRTLYNHFQSKERLFHTLILELVARISETGNVRYRPSVPLRVQLYAYAVESISHVQDAETLELLRAILGEHLRSAERVKQALRDYWKTEYGFVSWISKAAADGRLRVKTPERAAQIFQSLVKGVGVWPVVFGRNDCDWQTILDAVQEAVDVFLAYYEIKATPDSSRTRKGVASP